MQVKATTEGYYETLRQEGDVFEIQDEAHLGSWMEALEVKTKPKKAPAKKKAKAKKA